MAAPRWGRSRSDIAACGLALLPQSLAAVLFFLLAPQAAAAPLDDRAVDAAVRDALQAWDVPGVAVAIVRDDRIAYLKGHGVKELGGNGAITPDTIFPIASCTKAFTTTAMAMLVDDGKLQWDDPVRRHVSFFHLSDPLADSQVTLRDLVTHRTGLASHDLLWYRAPWSAGERVRRIGRVPLDHPFRTTFQYQSTMFTAAGLAVERASGEMWADYVTRRILLPLEMKRTYTSAPTNHTGGDRAQPHRRNRLGQVEPIRFYPMDVPDAAGSLHSTARDLAQWVRLQLGRGAFSGKQMVSVRSLSETHRPQMVIRMDDSAAALHPETHQMSYGMGWVIQDYHGQRLVSHAGAIDGFRAHITLVPQANLGIVLLSNLDQTRLNLALSNSLVDLGLDLPRKDWNRVVGEVVRRETEANAARMKEREAKRHHGTHPSLERGAYVGVYEHPAYGSARVTLERGGLVLHWNQFVMPLAHFHYDTFSAQEDTLSNPHVVFTLNEKGEARTLELLTPQRVELTRKRSGENIKPR